ncbi:unnamed protein product, partial [Ascophyllum nodosum]
NKDGGSKRKRPPEGSVQRAQKKGGRTTADHAQLDGHEEDETQLKLDRRKSKTAELQMGRSLRNVLKRGGALPLKLYAVHRRRADSVAEEGAGASCTFEVSFDPRSAWSPGVCEVCMAAASERANMARSVFKNKVVNVVRLKEGESPPAPDPAKAIDGGVHLSASGRPQRRTRAKRAQPLAVTCSSDDTVNFFKLKLGLSFSGFPHNGVSVFGGLTPMPTV